MAQDEFTKEEAALISSMWRKLSIQPPPLHKSVLAVVEYADTPRSSPTIQVGWCDEWNHWATTHGKLIGCVTWWMPIPPHPAGVADWVAEYKVEKIDSRAAAAGE